MIRAHDEPAVLTIDVDGPATMTESPAVQATASEQLARGLRKLRIDLRSCTTMDSTFTGTLLLLKRQLENAGGTFTLVSPSAKVLELLCQMGLEDFYPIEIAPRADGRSREIVPAESPVAELKRLVVHAHDELACIPGPASETFRAVAEELRRSTDPPEPPVPSSGAHL
jgi:anti-anti-sigma factor